MEPIRIAIAGVGNCASALVQGIYAFRGHPADGNSPPPDRFIGLMHALIGGYGPGDVEVVAAFDVDERKVGRPLHEAIDAPPNCTTRFCPNVPAGRTIVQMGELLDGFSEHLRQYPEDRRCVPARRKAAPVERILRDTGAEMLINYLPVGSQAATEFYARCCLDAGVSLINCIPVFIVSDETWAARFAKKGIPCVGDDVKSQLGATIVHRTLTRLFCSRGIKIDTTYQLNTGGNTDFLNMLNRDRLASKKISKTEAVRSQLDDDLPADAVHIGPSDYVPWQKDNKVCFLRIEGRGFGGVPMNLELRLSVEDSPNSAGVVIDVIRCCKLARQRGIGGPLTSIAAYTMKHPPRQLSDEEARQRVEEFIEGRVER